MKKYYDAGNGAGIRVESARHYVRKAELVARAGGEAPDVEESRAERRRREQLEREARIDEAMKLGFQRRRLPGEGVTW